MFVTSLLILVKKEEEEEEERRREGGKEGREGGRTEGRGLILSGKIRDFTGYLIIERGLTTCEGPRGKKQKVKGRLEIQCLEIQCGPCTCSPLCVLALWKLNLEIRLESNHGGL